MPVPAMGINSWAFWRQGVPPGTPLLDPNTGQFNRLSGASYQTSATTLTKVGADVIRFENVGDGAGACVLLERFRTNYNINTEQIVAGGGSWNATGGLTTTPNNVVAPDGTLTASTQNIANSAASGIQQSLANPNPGANVTVVGSVWVLQGTGSKSINWYANNTNGVLVWGTLLTGGATWTRQFNPAINSGTIAGAFVCNFQNNPNTGAHQIVLWGVQIENSSYPSSYIVNPGGPPTQRFPDVLQYVPAQVPQQLRNFAWQVPVLPNWSDTDIANGDEHWLFSFGSAGSGVRFRKTAGAVTVEALAGGVVRASSNALTFARGANLLVKSDGPNGRISVNGTPGPAGTPYVFDGAVALRQGGVIAADLELDGRMGTVVAA